MIKKVFIFLISACVIVLFAVSFLPHFSIFKLFPSLILVFFVSAGFTYFQQQKKYRREWHKVCCEFSGALAIGFLWDIFSNNFLGFHVLILLALIIFMKFIFKNYIQLPTYG